MRSVCSFSSNVQVARLITTLQMHAAANATAVMGDATNAGTVVDCSVLWLHGTCGAKLFPLS